MYRTLLGVSTEFVLIGCVLERDLCLSYALHTFSMRTNSVLTPCKARCGTFTLLRFPRYFHVTPYPKLEMVTTQVAPDSESTCGTAVCGVSFNTNLSNLTNRAR